MRKSFDGLQALVREHLELDAFAGHLFVFASRRRDRVKILYWDRDGFAVWSKRLEEGPYAVPLGDGAEERRREITAQELAALWSGIDLDQAHERNKIENLLREWLDAKRNRKSEQLSEDQLALFAALWQARQKQAEDAGATEDQDHDDPPPVPGAGTAAPKNRTGGRQSLPRHLKRERIVRDLPDGEKHCAECAQDLRLIGEETSARYEYIPAALLVIEEACLKYACACTVRTAGKPPQPIEKSNAGASLLAQVIVSKFADHLPLHRHPASSWSVRWHVVECSCQRADRSAPHQRHRTFVDFACGPRKQ